MGTVHTAALTFLQLNVVLTKAESPTTMSCFEIEDEAILDNLILTPTTNWTEVDLQLPIKIDQCNLSK